MTRVAGRRPGPEVVSSGALSLRASQSSDHATSLHGSGRSLFPTDYRMFVVIEHAAYVGIFAHAAFVPIFAAAGYPGLAWFNVGSVAAWLLARRLNRAYRQRLAVATLCLQVIAHAVLAVSQLGWDSGFQYYLLPLIPFLLFNDRLRKRVSVGGSLVVCTVLVALRLLFHDGKSGLPAGLDLAFSIGNLVVPIGILGLIAHYYRRASLSAEGRMERLASHDALTGLLNRRAMRERLEEEWYRTARDGSTFVVVMADIDHFKRINDTHGHDYGDEVLVTISQLLQRGLRQQDVVSRWGGEEYLMMLPATDLQGGELVTERIRASIEARTFVRGEHAVAVTMTFGVAQCSFGRDIAECVRRADEALYEGKAAGRNRVVRAG